MFFQEGIISQETNQSISLILWTFDSFDVLSTPRNSKINEWNILHNTFPYYLKQITSNVEETFSEETKKSTFLANMLPNKHTFFTLWIKTSFSMIDFENSELIVFIRKSWRHSILKYRSVSNYEHDSNSEHSTFYCDFSRKPLKFHHRMMNCSMIQVLYF